jgi:hypothetical protein
MPKDTSRRVTPTILVAFHHPSIARGRPIAGGKLPEELLPPCPTVSKPLTVSIRSLAATIDPALIPNDITLANILSFI